MIVDDIAKAGLKDVDEHDSGPAAESHSVETASVTAPASHLPFAMLNILPLDTQVSQRHAETLRLSVSLCRTYGPRPTAPRRQMTGACRERPRSSRHPGRLITAPEGSQQEDLPSPERQQLRPIRPKRHVREPAAYRPEWATPAIARISRWSTLSRHPAPPAKRRKVGRILSGQTVTEYFDKYLFKPQPAVLKRVP